MKNLETNLDPKELSKDPEEFKRFLIALKAMEHYTYHNRWQIDKINYDYSTLDPKYLSKMTYDYKTRVKRLEEAMKVNQLFLDEIYKKYDLKRKNHCCWSISKKFTESFCIYLNKINQ